MRRASRAGLLLLLSVKRLFESFRGLQGRQDHQKTATTAFLVKSWGATMSQRKV